jgi:hypothetical protein
VIDGHDVDAIEAAYAEAEATSGWPTAILARTKKGRGVKAVEDQAGKHGNALDDPEEAIAELGGERDLTVQLATSPAGSPHRFDTAGGELPKWEVGEEVATRRADGETLAALGAIRGDVVALDGEVSNSTHSEDFRSAHEDRCPDAGFGEGGPEVFARVRALQPAPPSMVRTRRCWGGGARARGAGDRRGARARARDPARGPHARRPGRGHRCARLTGAGSRRDRRVRRSAPGADRGDRLLRGGRGTDQCGEARVAGHAAVVAGVENRVLRVEVRDDGVGGASPAGTGLVGLADRLAVFDGRLEVDSPPGAGTRLTATIPLARSDRSAIS